MSKGIECKDEGRVRWASLPCGLGVGCLAYYNSSTLPLLPLEGALALRAHCAHTACTLRATF